jgi:hypothetical protein
MWPLCWGLNDLEPKAQRKVDGDNAILGRQMVIMHLTYFYQPRAALLMEHPEDPVLCSKLPAASKCASIWVVPEVAQFITTTDLKLI